MGLKSLRLEKGWSQEQLATISGLSERTIQRAERGDMPSLETVRALAASFELSHAQLRELIETQEDTPDMAANDTTAPTATAAPAAAEPANPVLTPFMKRMLLWGGVYVAVMTWLALMTQFAGWDPELLGYVGIVGGGMLATVAFSSLGGVEETDDTAANTAANKAGDTRKD